MTVLKLPIAFIALYCFSQISLAASVSGTVGYPDDTDTTLLTTGSSVLVKLELYSNVNGLGRITSTSTTVGIAAGELTTSFSLNVPTEVFDTQVLSYRVGYSCTFNSTPNEICSVLENSNPRFAGNAWYSETGMVPTQEVGQVYPVDTTLSELDIRFLRRPAASGTITLPSTLTTSETFNIRLKHYNSASDFPTFFSDVWSSNYLLSSGASAFDYYQPSNFQNQGIYTIEARCQTSSSRPQACSDFLSSTFYASTGSRSKEDNAEQIPFDANLSNRDFTMLGGKPVSITLKLPQNQLPVERFEVSISVEKLDDEGEVEARSQKILAFETSDSSQLFEFRVPEDETEGGYRVSYRCSIGCKNYFPEGWLNQNATVLDAKSAGIIPYNQSLSGLTMTMISGETLTGELAFPNGAIANEATPTQVIATLLDENCQPFATYVSGNQALDPGDNSRTYSIDIPLIGQSGYLINYICGLPSACLNQGYASSAWVGSTQMTALQEEATFLTKGALPEPLNVTLLDTNTPNNNPVYEEIGGQCSGGFCLPVKTRSDAVALICL